MRLAISFDYDSPAGYRQSFHMRGMAPDSDYRGAELLLTVLARHGAAATFGVVGDAAREGAPPEHCAAQIRRIHEAGHEIASHSMTHAYLPPLTDGELAAELAQSREVLERCTGTRVHGFVPPFNRPMHFPARFAFSFTEMLGLDGRGLGKQSVPTLCGALAHAGYHWTRVSFQNKWTWLVNRLGFQGDPHPPVQPFLLHGVLAIPLHAAGFGETACALVRQWRDSGYAVALYGHPNQAIGAGVESARSLDQFLAFLEPLRRSGRVTIHTMGELAALCRN